MRELRGGVGLAGETRDESGAASPLRLHHIESHIAVECELAGEVDRTDGSAGRARDGPSSRRGKRGLRRGGSPATSVFPRHGRGNNRCIQTDAWSDQSHCFA